MLKKINLFFLILIALLPSVVKILIYRIFYGYKIGKRVKIGFSILDAKHFKIDNDVSIGHFNLFIGIQTITIGEHARIGHLNIIRGGKEVRLGRYIDILRLNEINAIPEPIAANIVDSTFILGDGSVIAASHKIDFTDRVTFGKKVVLGGRNSSLWTHNKQHTKPITIGDRSYIGSEIRITPGGEIPSNCIVGIASVITKKFTEEYQLIAGVPAKVIKELSEEDKSLLEHKTRPDLPDDI